MLSNPPRNIYNYILSQSTVKTKQTYDGLQTE